MKIVTTMFIIGLLISVLFPSSTSCQQSQDRQLYGNDRLPSVINGGKFGEGTDGKFPSDFSRNHRLPADSMLLMDSMFFKRTTHPLPGVRYNYKRNHNRVDPFKGMLFPTGQISVIDTAVVISTTDTIRHVYSFDANAKMTSDLTQKMNCNTWVDSSRFTNTYNANGNRLVQLYEIWSNDHWVNVDRTTDTYDVNGRRLSELYETWSNGGWVNGSRSTDTYDARGKILSDLFEVWTNGQWLGNYRSTWNYDVNENMLSELGEVGTDSGWVNDDRYSWTYDANGNKLTALHEIWLKLNGYWWNDVHDTCSYDINRNILTEVIEVWSGVEWVNAERNSWTYDAKGNRLTALQEIWLDGQWVNYEHQTFTYDASGKFLTSNWEIWLNDQWVNEQRFECTYNADGKMLSMFNEIWSNGQWVNDERFIYTYDINGNRSSVWHYKWSDSSWIPMNYSFSALDSAGNIYNFGSGYNLIRIRSTIVTGVPSEKGIVPQSYSLSQNYPNPFNPTTLINYQLPNESYVRLAVYNILGEEVRTLVSRTEQPGEKSVQFDANSLPSGLYFYRLDATSVSDPVKHFSQTRKMLLIK
ncbi:MAG: T9SS type A sorting domain-containing protein [Bacteroidota bacterium]